MKTKRNQINENNVFNEIDQYHTFKPIDFTMYDDEHSDLIKMVCCTQLFLCREDKRTELRCYYIT